MPIDRKLILKAVEEAKKNSKKRKFNQGVDVIFTLKDIDLKKPENRINELIELPHSSKPNVSVVVFAGGDLALRAQKAGASTVMGRDELERFATDKKRAKKLVSDTDYFLAETNLMSTVGKVLGPILGPRGKMPMPVQPNAPIDSVVERHKKSVRVRVREQLSAQVNIGTEDMSNEVITDNIQAVVSLLERRFEKGLKNVRNAYVKTTMGARTKIEL